MNQDPNQIIPQEVQEEAEGAILFNQDIDVERVSKKRKWPELNMTEEVDEILAGQVPLDAMVQIVGSQMVRTSKRRKLE